MSVRAEVLLLILTCALLTFLPRVIPMIFFHRLRLNAHVIAWLRLLPPAILAALLVPLIFLHDDGSFNIEGLPTRLFAAIAAFAAAFLTRSIFASLIIGMGTYALIISFGG